MPSFDWRPLLAEGPLQIGILNLTPDSFSDGGKFLAPSAAVAHAQDLVRQGCRMLDLGAESTRPGAAAITPEEEWERLEAPLRALREALPKLPLSLDTRHAATAERGLREGVAVLNDVTGFSDPALLDLALTHRCGLIAMRSRPLGAGFLMPPYGEAGEPSADRAVAELEHVRNRLALAGLGPDRALLDPGFGFGTTFQEDTALWESLATLPRRLHWPAEAFCLGISRKRFTAWRAGQPDLPPDQRDFLSAALHQEAFRMGFRVFRTHAIR
jgi:dihydropteroate synthase